MGRTHTMCETNLVMAKFFSFLRAFFFCVTKPQPPTTMSLAALSSARMAVRRLNTVSMYAGARTLRLSLEDGPSAAAPSAASCGDWLRIGAACTGGPLHGAAIAGFFTAPVPQAPAAMLAKPIQRSVVDLYGEGFNSAAF
jgi:hypothetical protein